GTQPAAAHRAGCRERPVDRPRDRAPGRPRGRAEPLHRPETERRQADARPGLLNREAPGPHLPRDLPPEARRADAVRAADPPARPRPTRGLFFFDGAVVIQWRPDGRP